MGIKGLEKYLKSIQVELEKEKIPSGSVLVIDGNGWLFYLLKSIPNLEYGGSYYQLYDSIIKEIEYFQKILELRVVVFFDGENTKLKGDTRERRRLEIEERWLKFYRYCSDKTQKSLSCFDVPKPVFAKQLLLTTLNELNIETIISEFEADQDLGRFCLESSKNGVSCFCYGDDRYLLRSIFPNSFLAIS